MTRLSKPDTALLRNGDVEFFRKLIRDHTGALLGWVRSYADGPDEADDLVQEVWQRVVGKRSTYRGTGSFRGWLYRVTKSVCIDHSRRNVGKRTGREKLEVQVRAEALEDVRSQAAAVATRTPGTVATERMALRAIRTAVEELPPRQREVVTLRILEGMSTRETAEIMDCAQGTVKASLSQAIGKLRARLVADDTYTHVHNK